MIEAVIFDMDGVIINSENFWVEAEFETYNKHGINITREMCESMKGVKTADAVNAWFEKFHWKNPPLEQLTEEIIQKVSKIILERGQAMPGLTGLLEYLKTNNFKIGLATSSVTSVINVVMNKLRIQEYFDAIHSAEFEKKGKPYPDVYLGAAKKLGIKPIKCIAVEDSFYGLQAAKSAGMYAIALPEISEFDDPKYGIADFKIKSLKELIDFDFNLEIVGKEKIYNNS